MSSRTAGGASARSASPTLPEPADPAAPSGRPAVMSEPTRALRTAPRTETPIVPPRLRKKATAELAAPRSCAATVFCTASTRFCIVMPMPVPSTKRKTPSSGMGVAWLMVASSPKPRTTASEPATRNRFHRPWRVISCPETVEETSSPATIGMVSRPAAVGE